MASVTQVTLHGATGGTVTVQAGSGDHVFVAQIIANSILTANLNTAAVVTINGGVASATPPTQPGGQNILYLVGDGGGSGGGTYNIPAGYNYVVDLLATSAPGGQTETITGSNVEVVAYDSLGSSDSPGGTFQLTGKSSLAADPNDNFNVTVTGSFNEAAGDGNNTVTAIGTGTVGGGTGTNVFNLTATAGGAGILLQSAGASDTVNVNGSLGGATTVMASGTAAHIADSGNAPLFVQFTGTGGTVTGGVGPLNVTIASGSGDFVSGNTGLLSVIDSGTHDTVYGGFSAQASVTTQGSDAMVFGGFGPLSDIDTGTGDTIAAFGAGPVNVTLSGSDALLFGGSNTFDVTVGGSGNTVVAGSSTTMVTVGGTGSYFYGEANASSVVAAGSNDTIVGGSGGMAVTANSSAFGTFVWGGSGTLNFVGGNGPSTVVAGAGNLSITGGAGGSTLFGGAGSMMTYTGSTGNLDFAAGSGNETLNASGSSTNNLMWGGQAPADKDTIIGGTGNDTMVGGQGNDSLVGDAASRDWFVFIEANGGASPADTVTGFSANSTVWLNNYGSGAAQAAINGATSSDGNTTISLSDGTTITFTGVASSSQLQGHIISN